MAVGVRVEASASDPTSADAVSVGIQTPGVGFRPCPCRNRRRNSNARRWGSGRVGDRSDVARGRDFVEHYFVGVTMKD